MFEGIDVWMLTILGIGAALYYLRKYSQGDEFKVDDLMVTNKVIIITGANTGIGKEIALDLARRGGRIYMACRNYKKCEQTRCEIIEKTKNPNVFNRHIDLASMKSIREFVNKFLAEETKLDILINNAGIMNMPKSKTQDGYEMHIGVNHLGHFLLTNLLLDTMRHTAVNQQECRIVNVSSKAHIFTGIRQQDLLWENGRYCPWLAYCQSKLANILFTRQLAKLLDGTNVTTNSVHPGCIKTELNRNTPILELLLYPGYFFFKTARLGAHVVLSVALDPKWQRVSGKYFMDYKIIDESKRAQDDQMAEWLWRQSEKLTGLESISLNNEDTKI